MKINNSRLSQNYASALFDYADEQQIQSEIYDEVKALQTLLAAQPQLTKVLNDVHLRLNERQALLNQVIQSASTTMNHFLQLLFDYKRMLLVPQVLAEYERLYDQAEGHITITITTVQPLTAEQEAKLKATYLAKFGGKTADIVTKIQPSILGGAIIESNGKRIDGSLQTRLKQLRQTLLQPTTILDDK